MRTANTWEVRCPNCGHEHSIDIQITTWARLTPHGSDTAEAYNGAHEWDENSSAACHYCGHSGAAREFVIALAEADPNINQVVLAESA